MIGVDRRCEFLPAANISVVAVDWIFLGRLMASYSENL